MDKFEKVRQAQAIIESRAAQDREQLRCILKGLSLSSAEHLFDLIEQGKHSGNALHRVICILADVGVAQVLSEWDEIED